MGAVELWVAVPAGLALQIHPIATGITAAVGGMLGIMVVALTGDRLRTWFLQRRTGTFGSRYSRHVSHLWSRYGVVGLGLLAPLLVGAPLGTALGMTLGVPTGRLLFWMSLGVALCSAGLTLAGTLGLIGIQALGH
jgi:hypothetical protein